MPNESGYVEVSRARLYFEQAGTGDSLVLVHGLGANTRMWDSQFEAFSRRHHVIRYDMRGFGHSSLPDGSPYTHTGDLMALMEMLGIPQAHVIGHSMGGGVALDFALAYPQALNRLVLVDPALGGYSWSEEWVRDWEQLITLSAQVGFKAALPRFLEHPLLAFACQNPEVKADLKKILGDYSGWHFKNTDPIVDLEPPAIQRPGEVKAPTLIVLGEHDTPDFHTIAEILAKGIPAARLVKMPGVGHVAPLEAPKELEKLILDFIETH